METLNSTLRTGVSALALATLASAGDFTLRIESTLISIDGAGAATAPFSAAQIGAPLVIEYVLDAPGTPESAVLFVNGSPIPGISYQIDYAASTATLLGQSLPLTDTVPPPYEDGVILASAVNGVLGYTGVGSGVFSLTLIDFIQQGGVVIPSDDLATLSGPIIDTTTLLTSIVAYSETFPGSDGLVFSVNRIRVEPFAPTVGTSYCQAISNSTGAPAAITAVGNALVTSNDVILRVANLPVNSFGFFLASRTQASIPQPGGSQGVLCLGGSVGRFVGPGQIRNAGQAGAFELRIDLTSLPQPGGPVAAVAGETWNFTSWYRDSVGGNPTSNFTNGLSVSFQ